MVIFVIGEKGFTCLQGLNVAIPTVPFALSPVAIRTHSLYAIVCFTPCLAWLKYTKGQASKVKGEMSSR